MEDLLPAILEAPIPTILIVGGITFFLLAFFRKIGKTKIDRHPNLWILAIGIVLMLFGIGLLYASPIPKTQNLPFELTVYDFEGLTDETDIAPWFTVPSSKSYKARVSQDYSFSGKHSLRIFVDMQSSATNPATEYTGIGLAGEQTPLKVKAVIAWVFIPPSEPIQNTIFRTHILAYVRDDTGENVGFLGESQEITPGIWTPLFIGTFGETTDELGNFSWNGKINELYLTIWSDKPYSGSIYIDDFSIYK